MTLLVPNTGEVIILEALVNKTAPQNLVLKLFKSNTTPAETDTAATYTEADFTGYSSITLTGSSWGSAVGGAPSSIAYAQQTFTSSAGSQNQDIYGYYMVQSSSGTLVLAERQASSFNVANNGDTIKLTPAITAD